MKERNLLQMKEMLNRYVGRAFTDEEYTMVRYVIDADGTYYHVFDLYNSDYYFINDLCGNPDSNCPVEIKDKESLEQIKNLCLGLQYLKHKIL